MGRSEHPARLSGAVYDEAQRIPEHHREHNNDLLFIFYFFKSLNAWLFHDTANAFASANKARRYLKESLGDFDFTIFHCYDSLCRLAFYPQAGSMQKKSILRVLIILLLFLMVSVLYFCIKQ